MQTKILLRAYLAQNFGDDFMLRTLCRRYPQVKFYLQTERTERRPPQEPNLICVPAPPLLARLSRQEERLALQMDAQIYIGGSVFQAHPWWKQCRDTFAQRLTLPTFVLGATFLPLHAELCAAYRPLFAQCRDVVFRDEASAAAFADVSTVRTGCDMAEYGDWGVGAASPAHGEVMILPIARTNPSADCSLAHYEEALAAWCGALCRAGRRVTLAALCEPEGDLAACRRIAALCAEKIEILCYRGDLDAMLCRLRTADCLVATRFHALVAGAMLHKPVVPIHYHTKQDGYFHNAVFLPADALHEYEPVQMVKQAQLLQPRRTGRESEILFRELDAFLQKNAEQGDANAWNHNASEFFAL